MEIEFRKYDGTTVAMNPNIVKIGDKFKMKFFQQDCDYFLLFSQIPGGKVDINRADLQKALIDNKDLLPDAKKEKLMDGIYFSCYEYSDYKVNGDSLDLESKISEYTIVGCKEEIDDETKKAKMIVFIPDDTVSCTAVVSLIVSYSVSLVQPESTKGFWFKKAKVSQPYYKVTFGSIPSYQDGGIIYKIGDYPWEFPITDEMIQNGVFYLDSSVGEPRFYTKITGIELRRV